MQALPRDLWKWCAAFALALVTLEWWLYGRSRAWSSRAQRPALALKTLCILVGLLALVEPRVVVRETRLALAEHDLTPVIHSLEDLAATHQFAESVGVRIRYHLKLDTGMGRNRADLYRELGR